MGTETYFRIPSKRMDKECSVKLNDPLMGTETFFNGGISFKGMKELVKLNDPLMGTETPLLSISLNAVSGILLN